MTTPRHLLKLIKLPPRTSIYQYLLLEEALLRSSPHSYVIMLNGTNRQCVVSGVGNKPHEWLNQQYLHENPHIPVIKRYTGGGSVVASRDTLFVSFVFSKALVPEKVELFPRPIMRWSEGVYKPVFGERFQLLEYDYIWRCSDDPVKELNEDLMEKEFIPSSPDADSKSSEHVLPSDVIAKKFGGNAQYMTGGRKQRFCHHTSFLWDYDSQMMSACLSLPSKRPDYRADRKHDDFLIRMKDMHRFRDREDFFERVEERLEEMASMEPWSDHVELQRESMEEAWQYVAENDMVGTRYIDPLTGEAIDWESEYL